MKMNPTNLIIIALVIVVIALPAYLYLTDALYGRMPSLSEYCRANGYREVFPCKDGSFKAIRENYVEGFSQVFPNGSRVDCPFTLPEYQRDQCRDFVVPGFCSPQDICGLDNSCVSDLDCPGRCVNWTCS